MPSAAKRKLNSKSVQALVQSVRRNPKRKEKVIAEIMRDGFRKYVERTFELSAHQRKEVERMLGRDLEDIAGRACVMALIHNGPIEYVEEGHNPPNMRVEAYCRAGGGGVECGVRVSC